MSMSSMSTRRSLLAGSLLTLAGVPARAQPQPPVLRIGAVNKYAVSWVAAQLLPEIARQAGLVMPIEALPGPRVTKLTLSGELDGDLIRIQSYGAPYPQLIRVDPAYYRISVRAFSLAGRNAQVQSGADLRHYSVGAIRGMAFAFELTENHPALTLAQDSLQMFRMLQAGRLDLVLDTAVGARTSLERLDIKDMVISPELMRYELFLYLNVRHKDLAPRISEAIKRMRASGELERLTQRYESLVTSSVVERFVVAGAAGN